MKRKKRRTKTNLHQKSVSAVTLSDSLDSFGIALNKDMRSAQHELVHSSFEDFVSQKVSLNQ